MPIGPRHTASSLARHRIGLVSTYPPKLCGLATFAAALEDELRADGHQVDVVRIDDGDDLPAVGRPVVAELVNGVAATVRRAGAVLSQCDVVLVQHEYGIYGGDDGDEVLALLESIQAPTIVILHTVPEVPTANQRTVLIAVCRAADRVVVMSGAARDRLIGSYHVDASSVVTIPHGAAASAPLPLPAEAADGGRTHLLTWGLLGPGKGIEHAIDALSLLGDLPQRPRYTVAGVTHPKVFQNRGDEYRLSLIQRSWANGVAGLVTFDDTYRNVAELTRFVGTASAVVLPYDSREQVTSGVLVDAIAAGRPVIATAFPHAIELLSSGAGIVVPHADPVALADAIRLVATDPEVLEAMGAEARRLAPSLRWSSVAERYLQLTAELLHASESVAI
ncbi:MAG: glycosyl transferase family 1 [Ilumatobacteraceae bacterium]|nr:glycosyl transferase family 1 [Ilumatobacteraceae bacterium]